MLYNRFLLILFVFFAGCTARQNPSDSTEKQHQKINGMVWISGSEFIMGTDDQNSYEHERPAHRVALNGFWMDETEVTNDQFAAFVTATNYVTAAERKPTWEELSKQVPPGTPRPPDSLMVAGSLIFNPPSEPVMLDEYARWWKWMPGADWRHPEGPRSNIDERGSHPVVHVAYEDALTYCQWAGKRLPTEAEWELASHSPRNQSRYAWGNEINPQGKWMANTFQGSFPTRNLAEDGFEGTSPVKSFPANEYGLYDMIGNVWEWTSDWYDVTYFKTISKSGLAVNPRGSEKPNDPLEPYALKRVTKGGSFLCAPTYCVNYRPSARQGTAFDSGTSNIGFRCVKDAKNNMN